MSAAAPRRTASYHVAAIIAMRQCPAKIYVTRLRDAKQKGEKWIIYDSRHPRLWSRLGGLSHERCNSCEAPALQPDALQPRLQHHGWMAARLKRIKIQLTAKIEFCNYLTCPPTLECSGFLISCLACLLASLPTCLLYILFVQSKNTKCHLAAGKEHVASRSRFTGFQSLQLRHSEPLVADSSSSSWS